MKFRLLESIAEIAAAQWNDLLPPESCPLLEHGYLAALELSGSLANVGFEPRHLTLWSGDTMVAAAPCYLKHGERGDALPDWAQKVAAKHALPYFPTLFIGIPLATPGGPKLLVRPDLDRAELVGRLIAAAKELISTAPSPVIHFYFSTREDVELFERAGFHPRISPNYAWVNEGYGSFEAFLMRLETKRRTAIRKERRKVAEANVRMRTLRGADITRDTMELMWRFHSHTIAKHGADFDFFTRDFFLLLADHLAHRTELFMAERGGEPIGASLNVASATALYSRTCGAIDDTPYVHFEATWYHAMEEAIARGLRFIDPGGPGDHKLSRGFTPIGFHHSATWVGDEELSEAAGKLIEKERVWMPVHLEEQRQRSAIR